MAAVAGLGATGGLTFSSLGRDVIGGKVGQHAFLQFPLIKRYPARIIHEK